MWENGRSCQKWAVADVLGGGALKALADMSSWAGGCDWAQQPGVRGRQHAQPQCRRSPDYLPSGHDSPFHIRDLYLGLP